MSERYPWQEEQWQALQLRKQQGTLPHALLFTGTKGVGKREFAINLAQSLLCDAPLGSGDACQQCAACERFQVGTHPDFQFLEPEETGKAIKIDQIREFIANYTLASHYGGYKVVVIEPADAMNTAAANSLLKTLEEPPARALLILVTAKPSLLPATIRSRCQNIVFATPSTEQATDWLKQHIDEDASLLLSLAEGAPLLARQLAESDIVNLRQECIANLADLAAGKGNAVTTAERWLKQVSTEPINWVCSWVEDMIRYLQVDEKYIKNNDLKQNLQNLAEQVDLDKLYPFLDKVKEGVRLAHTSANQQMLLEGILLYWSNLPRNKR